MGNALSDCLLRAGGGLPLMAAGGSAGVVTVWNLEERKLHSVLRDAHDGPLVGGGGWVRPGEQGGTGIFFNATLWSTLSSAFPPSLSLPPPPSQLSFHFFSRKPVLMSSVPPPPPHSSPCTSSLGNRC